MRGSSGLRQQIDWFTVIVYAVMVFFGWLNIFAAIYNPEAEQSIFSFGLNSGRQLFWIGVCVVIIVAIFIIDFQFYSTTGYLSYGAVLLLLVAVLLLGRQVAGSTSWFSIGSIRVQPAEFAKFAVAIALAKYLGDPGRKVGQAKVYLTAFAIIALPALLIIAQRDTGTALVFGAFVFVLYREGLPSIFLIIGFTAAIIFVASLFLDVYVLYIAIFVFGLVVFFLAQRSRRNISMIIIFMLVAASFTAGVNYFTEEILLDHQRKRIAILINPDSDPLGAGYQVTQSKIAIGSGGMWGKGFLDGTQTKFDFVPDQSTDFIFCTVGEEHGWLGSLVVISLFSVLILRLISLAERQKSRFSRVFGYSVAAVFFFHFMINVGMTIGIFPVIGIPLPFFSYGGSSLLSFTIMLFIFLKLDAHRMQVLGR